MTLLDPSRLPYDMLDVPPDQLLDDFRIGGIEDLAAGRGPDWLDSWLLKYTADLVSWRRHLHANPELARREHATTAYIVRTLRDAGLQPRVLPTGTGVLCDIGSGRRTVALRADIDALPLPEATGLPFASTRDGVSHACGHDAHTAVVLGAGLALATAPRLPGRVRLVFQAAEEVQPGGALDVIAADGLDGVDRIFGLHCDPRLAVGHVGTRVGAITSAADMLELRVTGPGGHTARPHLTADVVHALATVVTGLPGLLSRRLDPRSGTVLVWGSVHAGSAANAIPRDGELHGTIRTGDRDTWAELEPLVRDLVTSLLAGTGVGHQLVHKRGVPPVVNDPDSTMLLQSAIETGIGESAVCDTEQSSGGEDFGWYLEHVPGAFGRLGVWPGRGPKRDLHQSSFDLDERALPVGVRTMVNTALMALG